MARVHCCFKTEEEGDRLGKKLTLQREHLAVRWSGMILWLK